ncbi:hypothetical protein BaRGS_00031427 [Batillaria attramentaria]|uniref:BTB domain-containing protein n=1 Tax=Batillaria attramentaria TaxID=370345 RepID=A0ABD0JS03_9CAEN
MAFDLQNENACKEGEPSTAVENPFEEPDDLSDLVLIVEDQKMHVNRTLLAVYSPVFARMFFSDGFKEKDATELPLPGKNYKDMLDFLLQLYPVHSFQPITDDNLAGIMSLADEYQVEHVLQKCENYIGQQLGNRSLSADQILLYLWMCDQCRIEKYRADLEKLAVESNLLNLLKSQHYLSVRPDLMRDIVHGLEDARLQNRAANRSCYPEYCSGVRKNEQLVEEINSFQLKTDRQKARIKELSAELHKIKGPHYFETGFFFYLLVVVLVIIIFHSFIPVSVTL